MTNEKLCLLAREGDSAAESSLLENILPSIRISASRIRKRYPSIMPETDDLVQEALIGSLRAIQTYDPESGSLFRTYASLVSENAMLDYVRRCSCALPSSGRLTGLGESPPGLDPDDHVTYEDIIPNKYSKNPEQLYIKKETIAEVRHALQMISERDREYLYYLYGFKDQIVHDKAETAAHFHLHLSRARSIERTALNCVRQKLPWLR